MLVQLAVRDIVLIDQLDLSFPRGLSVLTGETGAGKSILLDAFSLALGGRGDGGLVRQGAAQGQVTAVFELPKSHPAWLIAEAAGLETGGDMVLRRIQHADGRTRAFVNDQPAGVQILKAIGAAIVEIHGQHDDRALVEPPAHRSLLDAFGGLQPLAASVAACHEAWRSAEAALETLKARVAASRREADFLRHAAAELSKLRPEPREEQSLAEKRQAMQQSEKSASELNEAHALIAGSASPVASISSIMRRLERRADKAPELIKPAVKALDALLDAYGEAQQALDETLRRAAFDPHELERAEERLFALRAASRKYNTPADDLAALSEKFQADLAVLEAGESSLAQLETAARDTQLRLALEAKSLSAARTKAAAALDKAVNAELPPLKLDRANFTTMVEPLPGNAGTHGADRIEFWVQTNPGTKPGPMMKVASGGELSRFMLALKVVLADRGSAPTLVFDEVDAGVGGAVSDAIGARLARLAQRLQVLAVTHAPQVAVKAGAHFLISKESVDRGKRAATRVVPLAAGERQEEIARMLAGEIVTEEARAAAQKLLNPAKSPARVNRGAASGLL